MTLRPLVVKREIRGTGESKKSSYSHNFTGFTLRNAITLMTLKATCMDGVTNQRSAEAGTILLAEDDTTLRKMVTDILAMGGYRVIPACDGEDAYNLFLQHETEIDLVITDVVMPRMNGRQLGERCRNRNPKTRILYMSGYVDNCLDPREDMTGQADFIAKPFRSSHFLEKIGKLLGKADPDQESLAAS